MIQLPHRYTPWPHQLPVLEAMDRGLKRFLWIVHRRGGKDRTFLNGMVRVAMGPTTGLPLGRIGTYFYVYPTYNQGRKAIWDETISDPVTGETLKYLDHIPPELLYDEPNETEMRIELRDPERPSRMGSAIQIVGADKPDRLRSTNPVGVVFSEYAEQNPRAWDVIRPVLTQNGGWAAFLYTPKGRNHGYRLHETVKRNPEWFCQVLTVDDTKRSDGEPVVTQAAIQAERDAGMTEEEVLQEFYCSFDAGLKGAYYLSELARVRADKRIRPVPWEPQLAVNVGWDLGVDDETVLGCYQATASEVRWIDFYANSGEGLPHYIKWLKEKPYVYGAFDLPHDIKVREFTTGKARLEELQAAFPQTLMRVAPNLDLEDGISLTRQLLARSWFDEVKCERLVDALGAYRRKWSELLMSFTGEPLHDWASHPSDMVRIVAVNGARPVNPNRERPTQQLTGYARGYDSPAAQRRLLVRVPEYLRD